MIGQIPPHRNGHMLLEMIGTRAARNLSARLVVGGEEEHPGASDACAEFRHQALGSELGGSKNSIEVIEYWTVGKAGIIALRGPPRYFRANAYMLSHQNAGTNVSKKASHAGCFIQVSVTKGLDLGSGRAVVGASKPQVRRYFLRAQRLHGRED